MDNEIVTQASDVAEPEAMAPGIQPVDEEQVKKFMQILEKYKTGKKGTEQRILASENWWKLHNHREEQKTTQIGKDGAYMSQSAWTHNVIVSKHADMMESYPMGKFLPREEADQEEAERLNSIVPCVLERTDFESQYSDFAWQKCKTGTGVLSVVWDKGLLNGLGDIVAKQVNLLNLYWEPGIRDIQESPYFFHTELMDKSVLEEQYPELKDKLKARDFYDTKFLYDDTVDDSNKYTVINVYYKKRIKGKRTLQYCKFVSGFILFASENDPGMGERGLYDHGLYPYVFDPLYPIEGSPCGYGYIDICQNPQTAIDIMRTAYVKNAMAGATPRYWSRNDGGVNEEEFLDLSNPLVHVNNTSDDALKRIDHNYLDGSYLSVMDSTIQELRETSGNTETSTGNIQSGVTAASAIAALQEASGKGSRDSNRSSYRCYKKVLNLYVELIRQFYDLPLQFRITGQNGFVRFIEYSNAGLKPVPMGNHFGEDMGYRLPVFDIRVEVEKKNAYSTVAQNELALQLYKMGMFNPQMAEQAIMCISMMDFDGKDDIIQKISRNAMMMQKLAQYMGLALQFAQQADPMMAQGIMQDMAQTLGTMPAPASGNVSLTKPGQAMGAEPANVERAREKSNNASQPEGGQQRV